MARISKRRKLFIIAFSALVGLCAYTASYSYQSSQMTPWQKSQSIDFDKGTGSTKFNAHINSATSAGLAFCASAVFICASQKFTRKK